MEKPTGDSGGTRDVLASHNKVRHSEMTAVFGECILKSHSCGFLDNPVFQALRTHRRNAGLALKDGGPPRRVR